MARMRTVIVVLTAALALGAIATGCSSAQAAHVTSQTAAASVTCGTVRTAGGATAMITVAEGSASCSTVRSVLSEYYADLASGKAPGMGGGGPVKLSGGWTCVSGPATKPGTACESGDVLVKAALHR